MVEFRIFENLNQNCTSCIFWEMGIYNYHNEHTNICREMCNVVNTRFLKSVGVMMEKSSQMGPHLVLILLKSPLFSPL